MKTDVPAAAVRRPDTSVSLHALIDKIMLSLLPLALTRRNLINNEVCPEIRVGTDENMLSYVIGGLLTAALNAKESESIQLGAALRGDYTIIKVKQTIVFFSCFLFFFLGCKKQETCDDVVCSAGGVCVNGKCQNPPEIICGSHQHLDSGTCVCDTGWFGWNCDKPNSTCGLHAHGYENWCVCDTGWTGANCNVPIGSFVGPYHVVGVASTWYAGTTSPPPVYIDEIMEVTVHGDSLIARGHQHLYSLSGDTINYYGFSFYPTSHYNSYISFKRNFDDSVFYTSWNGGLGGGTNITLSGIRTW